MIVFSKEAYYGCDTLLLDTKTCEPWVLAFDKHRVMVEENGGYVVIPHLDEVGKGYFKSKAYVHPNWCIEVEDNG